MICTAGTTAFGEVAGLWDSLLGAREWSSVFLTSAWQQLWWEQYGGGDSDLSLLIIGPEDAPMGIAPLTRQGDTLTFVGGTDIFDYHDFIDCTPGFFEGLAYCLDEHPWRSMRLESVPGFSPTIPRLTEAFTRKGWSVDVEEEDVVPGVELPATWDEYVGGLRKKDRHELRRKLRRLESAGEYRVVRSTPESLTADVELFLDMMGESRDEKREFLQLDRQRFFRSMVERMEAAGYLRLFFLELAGGERVASVVVFDHDGRRLLYNSGYRLAHRELSTGLMLKALCIKDAIESGLTYFDFLRGPEPYKYHLGAVDRTVHRITVLR